MPAEWMASQSEIFTCPYCKDSVLLREGDVLRCDSPRCDRSFPVVDGTPILINEDNSLFRVEEVRKAKAASISRIVPYRERFRRVGKRLASFVPDIGANWKCRTNLERLRDLLVASKPNAVVLVVGSGEGDRDLARSLFDSSIVLVYLDVYFAPNLDVVADGHDLPFHGGVFDAVVAQSVLEHVIDPERCVQEIHRVLKPGGLVYAEVPFMQQVHAKAYDFTRYTHGGLLRLFRRFEVIDSGAEGGPCMALAWSVSWFFRTLSTSFVIEIFVYFVLPFFLFWLKYLDYWLIRRPQSADAASELYLLGRRSETVLPDREVIARYWRSAAVR